MDVFECLNLLSKHFVSSRFIYVFGDGIGCAVVCWNSTAAMLL